MEHSYINYIYEISTHNNMKTMRYNKNNILQSIHYTIMSVCLPAKVCRFNILGESVYTEHYVRI